MLSVYSISPIKCPLAFFFLKKGELGGRGGALGKGGHYLRPKV